MYDNKASNDNNAAGNKGPEGNTASQSSNSDRQAKLGFPARLVQSREDVIRTEWKTEETLEVIIPPGLDIEKFTAELKQGLKDLIDFNQHIDLMIKKEGDAYFTIIEVNKHSTGEN